MTDPYAHRRRTYEDIAIGETASRSHTFAVADIEHYAALIGDTNPLHLDPAYAATSPFGGQIAHGMHTAALFTPLLADRLPGLYGAYVSQDIRFLRPVRPGDTIAATLTVVGKNDAKRFLILKTTATNQHGQLVIDGQAVIAVRQPR